MHIPSYSIAILASVLLLLGDALCLDEAIVSLIELQHSSIKVHRSSFSFSHDDFSNTIAIDAAAAAVAAAAELTLEDVLAASDLVFNKAKFANPGSVLLSDADTPASFPAYAKRLDYKRGDSQYFVQFAAAADVLTLVTFQKFTGRPVVTHVQNDLFIAIGDTSFVHDARRFPGVSWVQARDASSKISAALQQLLTGSDATLEEATSLVAECWLDGCLDAAITLQPLCANVYIHPSLVEAVCLAHTLSAAVAALTSHVAIDHVDVKHTVITSNFGGRAILGSGINATTPVSSRVLSSISLTNSLIAIADTGVDVRNCFFYDDSVTQPPWSGGRVVQSYEVQSCERCGKCCVPGISRPDCSNSLNTCGNYKDESAHGTHVSGTVAGQGPTAVVYANGIANGSKIYFQDLENILDNTQCFKPDSCGFSLVTDLINLFAPALQAGA
jgi:subtilisin family serine protease